MKFLDAKSCSYKREWAHPLSGPSITYLPCNILKTRTVVFLIIKRPIIWTGSTRISILHETRVAGVFWAALKTSAEYFTSIVLLNNVFFFYIVLIEKRQAKAAKITTVVEYSCAKILWNWSTRSVRWHSSSVYFPIQRKTNIGLLQGGLIQVTNRALVWAKNRDFENWPLIQGRYIINWPAIQQQSYEP